jgi:carbamoyl-phosphate synthase large subunit
MNTRQTILITGVGGAAGVFLISHLQKSGLRVVAVDSNCHSVGLLHADANYITPLCTSPKYTDAIQTICEKESVSFILPLIDEELVLMKSLETKRLKVICPSKRFIEITLDKFFLMKELSRINICVPETFLLSEDHSTLTFPVVIKPRKGRGSRDVFFAVNNDELNKIILLKKDFLDDFIIQKKIEGDEYTVSVVANPDNQLITVVPKRIIEKRGITRSAVTEYNYEINTVCEEISKELKPSNPFNVQLILSSFDKKPYVFEINPRFSTTLTLTIAAGVDEIMIPLNFYKNPDVKMTTSFSSDLVLLRSVKENFVNFAEYNMNISKIINLK